MNTQILKRFMYAEALALVVVGLVLVVSLVESKVPTIGATSTTDQIRLERLRDEVFFTEDLAVDAVPAGCDTISVYSLEDSEITFSGYRQPSPGRLTADSHRELVFAARTNGLRIDPSIEQSTATLRDLYVIRRSRDAPMEWRAETLDSPIAVTRIGGIAVANDDADLLLATNNIDNQSSCLTGLDEGVEFSLSKFSLSEIDWGGGTLGPIRSQLTTTMPIAEIVLDADRSLAHLLAVPHSIPAGLPRIITVRSDTLEQVGKPIELQAIGKGRTQCSAWRWPLGLAHATLSPDGRFLVTNRFSHGGLNVADLERRTSWTLPTANISITGGVAFNHGQTNRDLLAVHGINRIVAYAWYDGRPLEVVAQRAVEPVINPPGRPGGNEGVSWGPVASLAWSAEGSALIAAQSYSGMGEFGVWDLDRSSGDLEPRVVFDICGDTTNNLQNDILTGNGLLPTYTPVATLTPSPTDTSTSTATPTAAATPTVIPIRTHTVHPAAVFLPVAVNESCDPTQARVNAALVIDASSSMREPATPGSAVTKLESALQAVGSFINLLALERGDQAAIVSFNSDAWLHVGLTSDRMVLQAALAEVLSGKQTRLDRGIEEGTAALLDQTSREPDNEAILIVLTDGRANPVPVDVSVERANDAKAAGVKIFAIGLGEDLEVEALQKIASEPEFYLHAPTTRELEDVYADVARSIPCPASAFWGRR